ncbi:MAG: glycosyltransferase family 4 protein [Okeania sp. SIO3B3]|nr:glycosyltransferase family 4 protein [Okeania sp. SIO3B3]
MTMHASVVAQTETVRFIPISAAEYARVKPPRATLQRYYREWRLFTEYATRLNADYGILMYFDFFQIPALIGPRAPCPFAAIYFRPTFHYHRFMQQSLKERFKAWRKQLVLRGVLRHLDTLLCLDPLAAEYIAEVFKPRARVMHLADPVKDYPDTAEKTVALRERLALDESRRVLLLFGTLDPRKGIYPLLEAVSLLPADLSGQMTLLLIGPTTESHKSRLAAEVSALQATSEAHIIYHNAFIPDEDVAPYFQLADIVLTPYQHHMGMSNVIVRAAAAQRPVLSSDYGLMGELVRRHKLGLAVDSTSPAILAQALETCLTHPPATLFDSKGAAAFAQMNTVEHFAQTLATTFIETSP